MAIIKPFRGLRYNQDIITDISSVVTPPYDVISPQDQERYYQIHPNNIIRLDLGKGFLGDTEENNKYTRAAEFLKSWREKGILKQEDAPAIYIYDQEFLSGNRWLARRGFISLVKLEPFDKGYIYPHEQTLPGPKADRLKLTQSCRANLSSIFALFPDENNAIDSYLSTTTVTRPEVDFTDDTGVKNKLWVIKEKQTIDKLVTLMKEKPLFIADGHHRYETALVYKEQMHKENSQSGNDLPSDYVMMVCVSMNNNGLKILPAHRLVCNIRDYHLDRILKSLQESFTVELLGKGCAVEDFMSQLNNETKGHTFVMYVGQENAYYKLRLSNEKVLDMAFTNNHPEWKHLDAGILHGMIIDKILGINSNDVTLKDYVKYVKDEAEAVSLVRSGQYQLAFFLNPTRIEQVREIAMARKVMPPKSTYFYPKLITGIVINSLNSI
ncbi:MAG: DUF1015 domain-containing protein [Candidatus Brocadia sp. AMX2]|uniref:DUF1015 domain-containing protein n=1 Tax=Candidatus Brocadia sinica JPN1 TaxID=1197129 RepID=A0ABQ0JXA3_9BACT|nr:MULTISPECIES: DUF1015 domain-containing protein [Brocadia]MBC6933201.1 DUF1015 domain-containing protein [Candidatus Brocadia sp.]MBL1169608.1 DUF1015 domain-containing protein [Candidatus Brocadia sp. AMX1]MCK6468200.1 DUF1015 domain-containing protein [Candidatus Brocadia sinica]NOG40871.1 DUF1015 domain-containing protein [Planctomycetota bacterium]KAA0243246.1 MAG: DUF1015 domain-containing protein [Candidatus Brocadia sp. AMX2]